MYVGLILCGSARILRIFAVDKVGMRTHSGNVLYAVGCMRPEYSNNTVGGEQDSWSGDSGGPLAVEFYRQATPTFCCPTLLNTLAKCSLELLLIVRVVE